MKFVLGLFAVLCLLSTNVWSEGIEKEGKALAASIAENEPIHTIQHRNEATFQTEMGSIEVYKLLYAQQRDANRDLIETLHWSIGLVFTFLLALAGSQIFYNYRLGKEELNAIRSESEKKISELSSVMQAKLSDQSRNIQDDLSRRQDEQSKLMDERIDLQKRKISDIEKEVSATINALRIELERARGNIWDLKGVKANAVLYFVNAAELELAENHQAMLSSTLVSILESLSEVTQISTYLKKKLGDLVEKLPEQHKAVGEKIVAAYANLRLYEILDSPDLNGHKFRYLDGKA